LLNIVRFRLTAHLGQFLVDHGFVVLVVASNLHDRLVAKACRVAQPARGHASGCHDVTRQDGHVVVQPFGTSRGSTSACKLESTKSFHACGNAVSILSFGRPISGVEEYEECRS